MHLFAIACKIGFDAGCGCFVAFTSKSELVEYSKRNTHDIAYYARDGRLTELSEGKGTSDLLICSDVDIPVFQIWKYALNTSEN